MHVAKFIIAPIIFVMGVAGYVVAPQEEYDAILESSHVQEVDLGGTIARTVAGFESSLASSLSDTDTTMTLVSFTTDDGVELTAGKEYAFTIDEGSSVREFVLGTASTSNRIVSMTRGVSVIDGVTEVTANKSDHRRGASVKITNFQLVTITNIFNDEETIPSPLRYESGVATTTISNPQHLTSKAYVDFVAFNGAGVIDANETAKGVVELATQTEQASSTESGSSGPLVLQAKNSTSTGGTTGNWVVVTEGTGNIDNSFIPDTISDDTTFTATTTFTGNAIGVGDIEVTEYLTSTTWVKPANANYVLVEVWGGGGSGGFGGGGGGGGGGAYCSAYFSASVLSATTTLVIGSGAPGITSGGNGNVGASTTFAGLVTAYGGGGGGGNGFGGGGGGGCLTDGITSSNTTGGNGGRPDGGIADGGDGNDGGLGGGSGAGFQDDGGYSYFGGGGGGGADGALGGNSFYGGGGGGSAPGGGAGGTSVLGGNGGAGTGANGSVPAGGGGGVTSGTSGAGANGKITVTVYFN